MKIEISGADAVTLGCMWIAGAHTDARPDDSAVVLICDHADHRPDSPDDVDQMEIAFHAGDGSAIAGNKPYFDCSELAEFIEFIQAHAASHGVDR